MEDKLSMTLDEIIKKDNPKNKRNGFNLYKRGPSKHGIKKDYRTLQTKKYAYATPNPRWFQSTKILVANLDFRVTDMELKELFEGFGPIKNVNMHYDELRRPSGSASLLFERRDDAERAVRQYNEVPLDGRPMKVSVVEEREQESRTHGRPNFKKYQRTSKQSQNKENQAKFKNNRHGNNGGRKPTVEELDAEMDDYNAARSSKGIDVME